MKKKGLISLFIVLLLLLSSSTSAKPGSCRNPGGGNYCNARSGIADCSCDASCSKFGDCCDDFKKVCGLLEGKDYVEPTSNPIALQENSRQSYAELLQRADSNLGDQNLIVIVARTKDLAPPTDVDAVRKLIFGESYGSVKDYYTKNSFEKTRLVGNVVGPYMLPENMCDFQTLEDEPAITAADKEVDFRKYSRILVIRPNKCGTPAAGYSTLGKIELKTNDGKLNASVSVDFVGNLYISGHELGHGFGALHANRMDCFDCTSVEYGDPYDIMGSDIRHFNAAHKEELGWVNDNTVVVLEGGEFLIKPIEIKASKGEIQQLKLPLVIRPAPYKYATDTRFYYSLEYRQPFDYDQYLPDKSYTGLYIHISAVPSPRYALPTNLINYENDFYNPPLLQVGKTYSDRRNGYNITLKRADSNGALVAVKKIPIVPMSINITYPKGREIFKIGEEVKIEWVTKGISSTDRMNLYLIPNPTRYDEFNNELKIPIAVNISNTGFYKWRIPDASFFKALGQSFLIQIYSSEEAIRGQSELFEIHSILNLTLADYPRPFIAEAPMQNAIFVVGDRASADEVVAMSEIIGSLQKEFNVVIRASLASDVTYIDGKNIVSVGSACSNTVTAMILNNPSNCTAGLNPSEGSIRLYKSNTDFAYLVVSGYGDAETRKAANVLANYKNYKLAGTEYIVYTKNQLPKGILNNISSTGINKGVMSGQAQDNDHRSGPTPVHVYIDGGPGAGKFHGIGTDSSGKFYFEVPSIYWDEKIHPVYAYAIDIDDPTGNSNVQLENTPQYFNLSDLPPVGVLDSVTSSGTIHGWAVDQDSPNKSISVHAYLDGPAGSGILIGSFPTTVLRPDVNNAILVGGQRISGLHGYEIRMPAQYMDKPRRVFVYGIDAQGHHDRNALLAGSPKDFSPK